MPKSCGNLYTMTAPPKVKTLPNGTRVRLTMIEAGEAGDGARLIQGIRAGDRVTIRTPQNQERTGRAVMRSSHGGWVLNMGGKHGTPGLADAGNIVRVKHTGRS